MSKYFVGQVIVSNCQLYKQHYRFREKNKSSSMDNCPLDNLWCKRTKHIHYAC